jgi:hypothetical protein
MREAKMPQNSRVKLVRSDEFRNLRPAARAAVQVRSSREPHPGMHEALAAGWKLGPCSFEVVLQLQLDGARAVDDLLPRIVQKRGVVRV